jgi:hypothetical protein
VSALVIAGLALIAALFAGVGPLSRLPYFQAHYYNRSSQERETQEAGHGSHGGSHG